MQERKYCRSVDDMDLELAEAYVRVMTKWLDDGEEIRLIRRIPARASATVRAGIDPARVAPLLAEAEKRLTAADASLG